VRIQVDPGGLETPSFDSINQEIAAAISPVASALGAAGGAAGNGSLFGAISDLADALATADRAAAIAVNGLAAAVVRAGQRYQANEAAIARGATPR
jgi:ABC-type Na+ efflux pump permease subunit